MTYASERPGEFCRQVKQIIYIHHDTLLSIFTRADLLSAETSATLSLPNTKGL